MSTPNPATSRQQPNDTVSLLLAGGVCCIPFLLPWHALPILSFQAEALAVGLGVVAVLAALLVAKQRRGPLPMQAICLLAFAVILAGQALFGGPPYPLLAFTASQYVLFAVALLWLGMRLAAISGIDRVATVLSAAILFGALYNAAAGVIQFYGRPALLEDVIAGLNGNRAYGNVAQANLYVNYLSIGSASLLYLWLYGRIRNAYAIPAGLLLAIAIALASSRGALLYAVWLAALGLAANRIRPHHDLRRLRFAACAFSVTIIMANFAIPLANNALRIGPVSWGTFERLLTTAPEYADPRWHIWPLALRAFLEAPFFGIGVGRFAGTVFEYGLPPTVTLHGEIWTSAHNLILHLMAETGAVGTCLVLVALSSWWWRTSVRFANEATPALWWIIAIAGIETIHALLEFPWWNAHFLGLTALVMGAGLRALPKNRVPVGAATVILAGSCAVLLLSLSLIIRDHISLSITHISGTSNALAASATDTAALESVTHGQLAHVAELWIVLGASLDKSDLGTKLERSARVIQFWPSNAVVTRRAVFLALNGESAEARKLLARALWSFPRRREETMQILSRALAADKEQIGALIGMANEAGSSAAVATKNR